MQSISRLEGNSFAGCIFSSGKVMCSKARDAWNWSRYQHVTCEFGVERANHSAACARPEEIEATWSCELLETVAIFLNGSRSSSFTISQSRCSSRRGERRSGIHSEDISPKFKASKLLSIWVDSSNKSDSVFKIWVGVKNSSA